MNRYGKHLAVSLAICGAVIGLGVMAGPVYAGEFHVATTGRDGNPGTAAAPLRTIQRAAELAQPGDVITVHAGVYRERVNPPRGGTSDEKRVVYRAAPGEKVVITGSEPATGWERIEGDVWKLTRPNALFGGFNPYRDRIGGDWFDPQGRRHHTGAVYLDGEWLTEAASREEVVQPAGRTPLWYAEVDSAGDGETRIWAQFPGVNPNDRLVEINARQTVFYPDQPGRNYITVRGFTMCQAATPWAPPTAEQIGVIGTHWSKGWIIESNTISHATCTGVTLGKHGDEFDNTSANAAEGYVKTIERAVAHPIAWSKENIGGHIVRDNTIAHCEQAGIVGSLGAAFSTVTGNTIHDIHVRRLFGGAEMGAIKFHGAIDVVISHNRIFRCCRGIWLDWMAQGARVSRNLLYDNGPQEDLFLEVNHGPLVVDNNLLLSAQSMNIQSQGSAFAHNLVAGKVFLWMYDGRQTPFHAPHATTLAGLHHNPSGDDRFFNNILVGPQANLAVYDAANLPSHMDGNVFLQGAAPSKHEANPLVVSDFDPALRVVEQDGGVALEVTCDTAWATVRPRSLVTTERLGFAAVPNLPYENLDGSPLRLDSDYFGLTRPDANPFPGPFAVRVEGPQRFAVWEGIR